MLFPHQVKVEFDFPDLRIFNYINSIVNNDKKIVIGSIKSKFELNLLLQNEFVKEGSFSFDEKEDSSFTFEFIQKSKIEKLTVSYCQRRFGRVISQQFKDFFECIKHHQTILTLETNFKNEFITDNCNPSFPSFNVVLLRLLQDTSIVEVIGYRCRTLKKILEKNRLKKSNMFKIQQMDFKNISIKFI